MNCRVTRRLLRSSDQRLTYYSLFLLLLLLLAGCGTSDHSAAQPIRRPDPRGAVSPGFWLISLNAITLLEEHGASARFLTALFNSPRSYVIIGPRQTDPFPLSIPVASFTSYHDVLASHVVGMASAFSQCLLPQGIKAVAYDPENWSFTAASEIAHPVSAVEEARQLVRQHDLQLISLPGMDLGTSAAGKIQPLPQSYASFVKDGYVRIAQYSDLFELQLENIETNKNFITLTQQTRDQVKAINPKALFFVQLTSNPNRQTVTADDLLRDYLATRESVDGYALTIPDSAAICPACGPPNVQAMLGFLEALGNES